MIMAPGSSADRRRHLSCFISTIRTLVLLRASSQVRYMVMRLPPRMDTFFTFCRVRPMPRSIFCSSALVPTMYSLSPLRGTKEPSGMMMSSPRWAAQISTSARRLRWKSFRDTPARESSSVTRKPIMSMRPPAKGSTEKAAGKLQDPGDLLGRSQVGIDEHIQADLPLQHPGVPAILRVPDPGDGVLCPQLFGDQAAHQVRLVQIGDGDDQVRAADPRRVQHADAGARCPPRTSRPGCCRPGAGPRRRRPRW